MEKQYKYKVCIHCMTYNHELYLADALEGFVMQKTDFPFVAVVIDDFSTDGTADVLRRYERKYPNIIKAVYLKENYYSQNKSKNEFLRVFDECSEFIATCEGDDYWTDPLKLQKQVDALESHPECSAAFCKVRVVNPDKSDAGWMIPKNEELPTKAMSFSDYLYEEFCNKGYCFHFCSYMWRANLQTDLLKQICVEPYCCFTGDFAVKVFLLSRGDCYYISDEMCCYRFMSPGSHNYRKLIDPHIPVNQEINYVRGYRLLDEKYSYAYHEAFLSGIQYGLKYIFRHAVRLPYKECHSVLRKYYDSSDELQGLPMAHMQMRYKYFPFPVFYLLERIRLKKNWELIETL